MIFIKYLTLAWMCFLLVVITSQAEAQNSTDGLINMETQNSTHGLINIMTEKPNSTHGLINIMTEKPNSTHRYINVVTEKPNTIHGSINMAKITRNSTNRSVNMVTEKPNSTHGSIYTVTENPNSTHGSINMVTKKPNSIHELINMETETKTSTYRSITSEMEVQNITGGSSIPTTTEQQPTETHVTSLLTTSEELPTDPNFYCPYPCRCSDFSTLSMNCNSGHFTAFPSLLRTYWLLMNKKQIERIAIRYNLIENIMDKDFANFTVRYIDLRNNPIKFIEARAFLYVYKLEYLTISTPFLTQLPGEFMQSPNSRLTSFYMNAMLGISVLVKDAFKHLHHLEKLQIRDSNIELIDYGAFAGLSSLKQLVLSRNRLTSIPVAFSELSSLENLDMEFNQISSISDLAFSGLNVLSGLNLKNNNLRAENIGYEAFVPFDQSLNALWLSENPLLTVPYAISRLSNLQYLFLDACDLTSIPAAVFMSDLLILDLSYNQIDVENSAEFFKDLYSHVELKLNGNNLTQVPSCLFNYLKQVHNLNLGNNFITHLGANDFKDFVADGIFIDSNTITDIHPDSLKMLTLPKRKNYEKWLSISDNHVHNLCFLSNLPNGVELNLRGNNFTCSCEFYNIVMSLHDASTIQSECMPRLYYPSLLDYMTEKNINCDQREWNTLTRESMMKSESCLKYQEQSSVGSGGGESNPVWCWYDVLWLLVVAGVI